MNSKIEIPLSKAKITGILMGVVVFIMLGAFLIINPKTFVSPINAKP